MSDLNPRWVAWCKAIRVSDEEGREIPRKFIEWVRPRLVAWAELEGYKEDSSLDRGVVVRTASEATRAALAQPGGQDRFTAYLQACAERESKSLGACGHVDCSNRADARWAAYCKHGRVRSICDGHTTQHMPVEQRPPEHPWTPYRKCWCAPKVEGESYVMEPLDERLCKCGVHAGSAWAVVPTLQGCPSCDAVWPENLRSPVRSK